MTLWIKVKERCKGLDESLLRMITLYRERQHVSNDLVTNQVPSIEQRMKLKPGVQLDLSSS
jgi:hypothetical protein